MSQRLQLSSVTVNCPDAAALAEFYARITDGEVTFSHPSWATMKCAGGRVDFQSVDYYAPARWPEQTAMIHLDFLVDDLEEAAQRVGGSWRDPILCPTKHRTLPGLRRPCG